MQLRIRLAFLLSVGTAALATPVASATPPPGVLWITGNNHTGGAGIGTTPLEVLSFTALTSSVVMIGGGQNGSMFAKADGSLWGMGENRWGQVGLGYTGTVYYPTQVPGVDGAIAATRGYGHSLFVKGDGTLWAMGYGREGQLGIGYKADSILSPTQVGSFTDVVTVTAAASHSFFIRRNPVSSVQTLWYMGEGAGSWGVGGVGQPPVEQLSPVPVATNVTAVATGRFHTIFAKTDGSLWAMGKNDRGQIGDTVSSPQYLPVQIRQSPDEVAGLSAVIAVAAGIDHSVFLTADGSAWAMGENSLGQLGNGDADQADHPTPTKVELVGATPGTTIVAISAAGNFSLFLDSNRNLWATGQNANGQLGTGDQVRVVTPRIVARAVLACSAGGGPAIGGSTAQGITMIIREPVPTISSQPSPAFVPAGTTANFAVAATGTVSPLQFQWWRLPAGGGTGAVATTTGAQTAALAIETIPVTSTGDRYYCLVSNEAGAVRSITVPLVVLSTVEVWRQGHFGTTADTGDAADAADPDHDGRTNLLEYATGTNPGAADSGEVAAVGTTTGAAGDHLQLTFLRLAYPEIVYTVEASDTLGGFTPIWSSTGAENANGWKTVVDEAVAVGDRPRRFLRLVVTH